MDNALLRRIMLCRFMTCFGCEEKGTLQEQGPILGNGTLPNEGGSFERAYVVVKTSQQNPNGSPIGMVGIHELLRLFEKMSVFLSLEWHKILEVQGERPERIYVHLHVSRLDEKSLMTHNFLRLQVEEGFYLDQFTPPWGSIGAFFKKERRISSVETSRGDVPQRSVV
ncbi:hypothetical protein Tco_0071179 [Tanacetum coccineum]